VTKAVTKTEKDKGNAGNKDNQIAIAWLKLYWTFLYISASLIQEWTPILVHHNFPSGQFSLASKN